MTNAIFSIKPQYAHAIMNGTKRYEYRKRMPRRELNKIYVYSTSPDMRVIGHFTVKSIHQSNPLEIWLNTYAHGGIAFEDYENYFRNSEIAYAIEVDEFIKYDEPKLYIEIDHTNKVPQSFKYTEV